MADSEPRRSGPTARITRLIGAIVAGGSAARFDGAPKGLQIVGGSRIVDRVLTAMRAVTSEIVLISNSPDAFEWLSDVGVCPDVRPERGSLVGIHTALSQTTDSAIVVAWDMPFVTAELLRRICERGRSATFGAIPEGPRGLEPLCALYTRACLPIVETALDGGDLRLSHFIQRLPEVERIPLQDVQSIADPARLFFNVNSAEDLALAERMASGS